MLITPRPNADQTVVEAFVQQRAPLRSIGVHRQCSARHHHVADVLKLLNEVLTPTHRVVKAGEPIYLVGESFGHLHILNAGLFKVMGLSVDGREQIVGLKFRGDWLGLDGIAAGRHSCCAVAMDTSEVWTFRYDALLAACVRKPALLAALLEAMGREMTHDREALMSVSSKPVLARVGEFLCHMAESLTMCGLRSDDIFLRLTRAEIGNYLGMRLETVSRAMSRLVRAKMIEFHGKGRRELFIPDLAALAAFVQDTHAAKGSSRARDLLNHSPMAGVSGSAYMGTAKKTGHHSTSNGAIDTVVPSPSRLSYTGKDNPSPALHAEKSLFRAC